MTLKQFTKHLKAIQNIEEVSFNINTAFKGLERDMFFHIGIGVSIPYEILVDAMDDKDDWIGYYLWEMDGKFTNKAVGNYSNGKKIYIKSYKDLYNLIKG